MLPFKNVQLFHARGLNMEEKNKKGKTITSKGEAKSPFMLHKLPSLTNLICYQRSKTELQSGDKSDCEFLFVSEQNGEKVGVRRSVLLVCLLSMSWSCREQCTGKTAHYGRW